MTVIGHFKTSILYSIVERQLFRYSSLRKKQWFDMFWKRFFHRWIRHRLRIPNRCIELHYMCYIISYVEREFNFCDNSSSFWTYVAYECEYWQSCLSTFDIKKLTCFLFIFSKKYWLNGCFESIKTAHIQRMALLGICQFDIIIHIRLPFW